MMRVNPDNSLYFIKWFFFETMAVCPGVLTWRQMASLAGFGYRGGSHPIPWGGHGLLQVT